MKAAVIIGYWLDHDQSSFRTAACVVEAETVEACRCLGEQIGNRAMARFHKLGVRYGLAVNPLDKGKVFRNPDDVPADWPPLPADAPQGTSGR